MIARRCGIGLRGCMLLLLLLPGLVGCNQRDDGILRQPGDYFDQFTGQWTSDQNDGGADWEKHWALSLGKDYSVFLRTPEGQVFRGTVEMRFDLGADAEGKIRMPPGSTLFDMRLDEGPEARQKGQYLLGAIDASDRYLVPKRVLNACLGAPGGTMRAISWDDTREGLSCFELYPLSGEQASKLQSMAGRRGADGVWRVSKYRDAGAYIKALMDNMSNFGAAYLVLMPSLFIAALFYWKLKGEKLNTPRPLPIFLFPYVGPQLRIVLWRTLLGTMLLVALPLLLFFFPQIAIVIIGMHLFGRLRGKIAGISLARKLGALILLLAVGLGLLAPMNLLYVAAYHALGQPPDGALYDLAATPFAQSVNRWAALAGASVVTLFVTADAFWRLRQARTIADLATSKAASVGHGLVELAGIAHPARGAPAGEFDLLRLTESTGGQDFRIEPFDLEDASGRILIDPRGASFNPGWLGDLAHVFIGFHEIALNNRIDIDKDRDSVTRTLAAGDPVYVIGDAHLQRNEATDKETKVISPLSATFASPFRRLICGEQSIFFISDSGEEEARKHLLRGFRRVWLAALLWLAASTLLYWSAL